MSLSRTSNPKPHIKPKAEPIKARVPEPRETEPDTQSEPKSKPRLVPEGPDPKP